jgi:hypothetical protein
MDHQISTFLKKSNSALSHSGSLKYTALTGKEDFVRFVYPRLALGPKMAK